ncbi:NKIRAS1 (predicted) [Pycnogonum litorale]
MGKLSKVIICGPKGCGKTSILEQVIYNHTKPQDQVYSTVEDIYTAYVETDRGTRERLMIYDTAGLDSNAKDIPKHYHQIADAYVLVYAINSKRSFDLMDIIKKDIEKNKEKKEIVVIVLGNKCDLVRDRVVDVQIAQTWSLKEKVRLFEVSITDRKKLLEAFVHLSSKLNPTPNKSAFAPLGRKTKAGNINMEL